MVIGVREDRAAASLSRTEGVWLVGSGLDWAVVGKGIEAGVRQVAEEALGRAGGGREVEQAEEVARKGKRRRHGGGAVLGGGWRKEIGVVFLRERETKS